VTAVSGSPRRWRLASPVTALIVGGFVLAVMVAQIPLAGLAHQGLGASGGSLPIPFTAAYGVVGLVVAVRRPANPLGWLLLGTAAFITLSEAASFYTVADYRLHHGGLPLGWLAVLLQPGWAPGIVLIGLVVLLFPDGHLPSPRWRWVIAPYLLLGAAWLGGAYLLSAAALAGHHVQVDSGGNLLALDQSTGQAAWWDRLDSLFFPVQLITVLIALASQAISLRRATGERRQQLKWLLAGAAVCVVGGALTALLNGSHGVLAVIGALAVLGLLALPVGIGVGILKYRLLDIDRIISRTLAYALLTGLLVGVYAGLVLLATGVLGLRSTWAVAASTLAAAALFSPLRKRVQRVVDRRFNRARFDADQIVTAFAARLKEAVDLDPVHDDLVGTVSGALEPAHVSVWINGGRA